MKLVSLKSAPREYKLELLDALGMTVGQDGVHVVRKQDGAPVIDPYARVHVRIDNMMILPGSALVLDENELSLISYLDEKGEIL